MICTTTTRGVILDKSDEGALDLGPIESIKNEKLETARGRFGNITVNGSSVVAEDDRSNKGTRKAQALKANLAKRKQQQRSKSLLSVNKD